MPETCVVIPTYNEKENISDLITAIESLKIKRLGIVIVDDNSPDGTAKIAEDLNRKYKNTYVIKRKKKEGIGGAVIAGMRRALEFKECKRIVTMDGDFSHLPEEMPRLLEEAEKGTDLVQGSRYMEGGKIVGWPFHRRLISWGANIFSEILFRFHMTEHTTFYRIYSRRLTKDIVDVLGTCTGFELAIKTALLAKKKGYSIGEVPITFVERQKGKSKISPFHIVRWFLSNIKLFFKNLFGKI
jgi:dolichol-phosphate mannosyltransferase